MSEESYEERLDKRLSYVDELKARIAELESEAAAFDTALWSGRLQEVEQYNANANARIAELEAQVAEAAAGERGWRDFYNEVMRRAEQEDDATVYADRIAYHLDIVAEEWGLEGATND